MKVLESKISKRVAVSYLLTGALDCSAANCLKDAREVASAEAGAQATQLRSYLCGANGRGVVQLEFNRMNDLAMGLLMQGKLRGPVASRWRNARIIPNQVLREFERLIAEFGVAESDENFALSVEAALPGASGGSSTPMPINGDVRTIVKGQGESTAVDFPDPAALASITSSTQVPAGYATVESRDSYLIWRFMRADDVLQYGQKVAAYNQLVVDPRFQQQFSRFRSDRIPREMRLYAQLFQGGMPNDFLFVRGYRKEGGCSDVRFWEFRYFPRRLLIEVVAIENVSGAQVRVDGLLGQLSTETRLQPVSARGVASGAATNITGSLGTLPPGGVMLVPLSLTWAPSEEIAQLWDDPTQAPRMLNYNWGARLDVSAVAVDGRALELEGRAANFFSVTTSCPCGSCPYVHAWDATASQWVDTGVMLEFANAAAKTTWDWRRFEGAVLRFRVQEEEAEFTRLCGARLELVLLNGDQHTLWCKAFAGVSDVAPIELMFNQAVELSFALPRGVRRAEVRSSTLWLRGYYERYTDILASNRSCVFTLDHGETRLAALHAAP